MYHSIQLTNAIQFVSNSLNRGNLLSVVTLIVTSFALAPTARAVDPPPDGAYPSGNTAEGQDALFSLTTGANNTAIGAEALYSITIGNSNTAVGLQALHNNTADDNTAIGASALYNNTTGTNNTASGWRALLNNTTGSYNTATGLEALLNNTIGNNNTANGYLALGSNTTGSQNTAAGYLALGSNTTGSNNTANGYAALNSNTADNNTANGYLALYSNTTGSNNIANGVQALFNNNTGYFNVASGVSALSTNVDGHDNTAEGFRALQQNTGSNNIALGSNAGGNLTTGINNIDIGNVGKAGEGSTIRIGKSQNKTFIAGIYGKTVASGVGVIIGSNGQLGTVQSSARFKDEIKPMDKTSEAILALQPVTFHYKHELDPDGIPQFGLVAEQVEKVNPDLVARDEEGKVYTVRYEAVNAMLLNEFLKEHRKVEEQDRKERELEATVAQQQKEIKALTATVQNVRDQMELNKADELLGDHR
jgi:hypothetical protein